MSGLYFDARWCRQHGIGRFATEIRKRLSGWTDVPIDGYPTDAMDSVRLATCLKTNRAELFFSPGFNVPAYGRCTTICTIHDLIHVHYPHGRSRATLAYYKYLQRPVVRRSPLTLTVSEYSRQQIIDWYDVPADRVVCVGNGVSEDFCADGERAEADRPYFLYVGNTRPHKNVDVLLSAMTRIDPDATLTMVLSPDERLHRSIADLKLTRRITFMSGLSDAELAKHYRGAVATVLPSHYEGFGLPIVESMACGCPVIAANRTSIPEIVADAGILFDADNADELAHAMTACLTGRDESMACRGIDRAGDFRWDDVTARIADALSVTMGVH